MIELSQQQQENAREIHSSILRAVAEAKQSACAKALGVSEGQVSKLIAGDNGMRLDQLCGLLAFLNLGINGAAGGLVTVSKTDWDALRATISLYAQKAG